MLRRTEPAPRCQRGVVESSHDASGLRPALGAGLQLPRAGGPELPHAHRLGGPLRCRTADASRGRSRLRADPGLPRGTDAPEPSLPPEARDDPPPRASGVGRRRDLQHPLSRPPYRASAAGRPAAAEAAHGSHHVPAARPREAALGAVVRGGRRRRALRAHQQGPPLSGRRDRGDRSHHRLHGDRPRILARARSTLAAASGAFRHPAPRGRARSTGDAPAHPRARGPARARRSRWRAGVAARHGRRPVPGRDRGLRRRIPDPPQPADRTAPALRLEPHRARQGEGDPQPHRREGQRRRARRGDRRGARLPGATRGEDVSTSE